MSEKRYSDMTTYELQQEIGSLQEKHEKLNSLAWSMSMQY